MPRQDWVVRLLLLILIILSMVSVVILVKYPDAVPRLQVGPQGISGPAGKDGLQGPQGLPGIPGPQGLIGTSGQDSAVPGPEGSTGKQGETGLQGPPGSQGDPGAPGREVEFRCVQDGPYAVTEMRYTGDENWQQLSRSIGQCEKT